VVHQVGADGVVNFECEGELELGANSIGAGYEHGLFPLRGVELEEAAEAADVPDDGAIKSSLGEILDALLGTIADGEIHTGIGIGDRGRHRVGPAGGRGSGTRGQARPIQTQEVCGETSGKNGTACPRADSLTLRGGFQRCSEIAGRRLAGGEVKAIHSRFELVYDGALIDFH
jgi:hypothetical protein